MIPHSEGLEHDTQMYSSCRIIHYIPKEPNSQIYKFLIHHSGGNVNKII